jgi:hypothetical protein
VVTATALVAWLVVLAAFAIHRPPWGDEDHYYQTILRFGSEPSWELLRTYPGELAPPLSFLAYAAWGRIVGFDLPHLRWLSIAVALAAFLAVHRLGYRVTTNGTLAAALSAFVAVHPYNVGLSVFVFNDMLAMLFIVGAAVSAIERRVLLVWLCSACGLLSRQYMAFAVLAVATICTVRWWRWHDAVDGKLATAATLSFVPLLALMGFWQGFGPDNEARVEYLQHGLSFKPSALMLYLAVLSVYLAPVTALFGQSFTRRALTAGVVALCAYPLWPVVPADAQLAAGITTAGFLHRAVDALDLPLAAHVFWAVAAAAGATIAAGFGERTWRAVRDDRELVAGLLCATVLWFLLLMPFSYMYWEKYFMPVLPFAALALVQGGSRERAVYRVGMASGYQPHAPGARTRSR